MVVKSLLLDARAYTRLRLVAASVVISLRFV
jgi:hypothetical protein